MRSTIITFLSLACVAVATPTHAIVPRATCEKKQVTFHFNDTSFGSVPSCATDVMDRGSNTAQTLIIRDNTAAAAAPHHRRLHAFRPAARAANTTCVDGPLASYTVVRGDTLEKIAAEASSGVCNIAAASKLDNPDFVAVDQVLVVPTDVCPANIDNRSCRTSAGQATCLERGDATYEVEEGDTFFLIAANLGLTLDSLVAANPNQDPGSLQIGQLINIPVCAS